MVIKYLAHFYLFSWKFKTLWMHFSGVQEGQNPQFFSFPRNHGAAWWCHTRKYKPPVFTHLRVGTCAFCPTIWLNSFIIICNQTATRNSHFKTVLIACPRQSSSVLFLFWNFFLAAANKWKLKTFKLKLIKPNKLCMPIPPLWAHRFYEKDKKRSSVSKN